MKNELKNCPECLQNSLCIGEIIAGKNIDNIHLIYQIFCENCKWFSNTVHNKKENLISEWNTRAKD